MTRALGHGHNVASIAGGALCGLKGKGWLWPVQLLPLTAELSSTDQHSAVTHADSMLIGLAS